jgi:cAMP-dependent protein kinase regulator
MILRRRASIDRLDQYLAQKDYASALEAITEEVKRKPENFNLLLRQAEILGLAGNRDRAVEVYRDLARFFARQGFYARALAVISKLERLDPGQREATRELAAAIAAQQEEERAAQTRRRRTPADLPPGKEESKETPPEPEPGPERERSASRLFTQFPAGVLEELLASTNVRLFTEGQTVCREGDPGHSMFLLVEGTVDVTTADQAGRPLPLATLSEGEFFGEVALLKERPRTATVSARSQATVLEITREQIDALALRFPEINEVLERFCQERAHATVDAMVARMRGDRD